MRKILYTAVFFSGMTTMAIEFAAERLLGNYFGTSNLVWAAIIGLIMIYLTAGYFLGGAWADRSPTYHTFFKIMAWGALSVGLVPLVSRPVLRMASSAFDNLQFGLLIGSFVAVLILLIIPVTLLGTASPFAIRLAIQNTENAGRVSGRIYAISTIGSFIGTFLPSLVFIPLIGTYRTFLAFSGILLIVAIVCLWLTVNAKTALKFLWMPVVVAVLAIVGTSGSDKNTEGLIYETESSYNYIQVQEINGYHLLRLNDGQGYHSIYHPDFIGYSGPWEQVLVAPFFNPAPYDTTDVKRAAIVGLAAGTAARELTAVYGSLPIDGWEIDPVIVDVAQEYFDMNEPNLTVFTQDGRVGLRKSPEKYQLISVDAYRPPYIPWHMTTREFFQEVYDHLSDDGVMIINVGRAPSDRRLLNTLAATIQSVFPSLYVIDIPETFNSVIIATAQPTSPVNLAANYDYLLSKGDTHPLLLSSMETALRNIQPDVDLSNFQVFTDDVAPIEWLTNSMIVDYVLSGEVEELQQ